MKRKKTLGRRVLYPLLLVTVVAMIGYSFLPTPVTVTLAKAIVGPLSITVQEDGMTRIKEKYTVSVPLAGRLRRIDLHPGDSVSQGESVLAVLDPQPPSLLDPRSRAEAEARAEAADMRYHETGPLVEQAKAAAEILKEEFQRAEKLFERSGVSHEVFDRARLEARMAEERLRAAEFARQVADYERKLARAALIHTQRDPNASLEQPEWRIEIRSPISGRVLRVFQESAMPVAAGAPILEVGNPLDLEIVVDVLSNDAVRILPGQKADLLNWGGDQPIPARVRLVEPSAFTKISALGVEEQRVNVILDLTDPESDARRLGDRFRVDAKIEVDRADQAILIPNGAIFRQADQTSVFIVRNRRAYLRAIRTGRRGESMTEVLDGLAAGESIITYPSDKVAHGVLILGRS